MQFVRKNTESFVVSDLLNIKISSSHGQVPPLSQNYSSILSKFNQITFNLYPQYSHNQLHSHVTPNFFIFYPLIFFNVVTNLLYYENIKFHG